MGKGTSSEHKNIAQCIKAHNNEGLKDLAVELHLQILRHFLIAKNLTLYLPVGYNEVSSFGLGSLGILRVSRYWSASALSVLYKENTFRVTGGHDDIGIESKNTTGDPEDDPFSHKGLQGSRWRILRELPQEELATISSLDCLDMISQMKPGQEALKHLSIIDLDTFNVTRFMDGVLPRILRRMRGLQIFKISLFEIWEHLLPAKPDDYTESDWPERFARNFLLLTSTELGHIKSITIHCFGEDHVATWMQLELVQRNKSWKAPPSPYEKFRRTTTNVSILDSDIVRSVAEDDDDYKSKLDERSPLYLARKYGHFPWSNPN